MTKREEFLLRRMSGIGGSDIGAICGVSPWKSPLDVYWDKVAEPESIINQEAFPVGETKSLYWGAVHEAAVADAYSLVSGVKLMRYNRLITHPEKPYFIANVDRLAYLSDGSRPFNTKTGEIFTDTGIEIKTARFKDDEWGDEGTDDVPAQYFLQCQWYMGLIPTIKRFILVVLFGGNDMKVYCIERDQQIIDKIQEIGDKFWNENVAKRVPPPPRTFEEVKSLFPSAAVVKMTATAELEADIRLLAELTARRKYAEQLESDQKFKVAEAMAECEMAVSIDGTPLATFKEGKRGRLLSVKVKVEGDVEQ